MELGSVISPGCHDPRKRKRMTDFQSNLVSRRQLLRQVLATGFGLPLAEFLPAWDIQAQPTAPAASPAGAPDLSAEDDQFLNDLQKASFLFFLGARKPQHRNGQGSL
jgi:hypothetical protein